MRLIFAHGLESGPWGRKSIALRDAGHDVLPPDCRGKDLPTRISILIAALDAEPEPPFVVGSSFGGIAALVAALHVQRKPKHLLLCAPALQLPAPPPYEIPLRCPCPTTIIHGTRDEIIPIDLSRRFAKDHGARLIEVDDDHGLSASLPTVLDSVQ